MVTVSPRVDQQAHAEPARLSGDALGDLLDDYQQPAFDLAYRLLRRSEDAADAVQDAFVLALRALRSDRAAPREPGRFGPWLLKIVANAALGQLRRRRPGVTSSLDLLDAEPADDDAEQPSAVAVTNERRRDVLRTLLCLPDAQRAALALREYQGLSYDEIGEMLGLNRAATTALLYRARASFRAAYEGLSAQPRPAGCPDLAPLISAMLDDELEPGTWKRVERHVAECLRCQRELRALRDSRRLYRTIPLLVPPAGWSWSSALSAAGVAAVAAPAVVGGGAAVPAVSTGGGLVAVGGTLLGKVAGVVLAAGLGLAVTAGSLPDRPVETRTVASAAPRTEAVPSAAAEPAPDADIVVPPAERPEAAEPAASVAIGAPAPGGPADASAEVAAPADAARAVAPPAPTEAIEQPDSVPSTAPSSSSVEARAPPAVAGPTVEARTASQVGLAPAPPAPAVAAAVSPSKPEPSVRADASALSTAGATTHASDQTTASGTDCACSQSGPPRAAILPTITLPGSDGRPLQADQLRLQTPPVEPPRAEIPAVEPPTIETPKVQPPAIEVPPVDLPRVETPSIEAPAVEMTQAALPSVQAPSVEAAKVDPPKVSEAAVEPSRVRPAKIDPPRVEPAKVQPPKVQSSAAEPPKVQAPSVQAPNVQAPRVEPVNVQPPKVDPPKAQVPGVQTPKIDVPKTGLPKL